MPFCFETCIASARSRSAIASAEPAIQEHEMHLAPTILDPISMTHSCRLLHNWYIESIEGLAHRTGNDMVRSRLTSPVTCGRAPYLDATDLAVAASFPGPASYLRLGPGATDRGVQLDCHGVVVSLEYLNIVCCPYLVLCAIFVSLSKKEAASNKRNEVSFKPRPAIKVE